MAIGDVDGDGLPDVFFTANMGKNRLYLNKGNWKFEDVTDRAGVAGRGSWSTGVAMADVDGDGRLDIYVCNSGNPRSNEAQRDFHRENELFINNGDGTFTEKAREYGLADQGLTTHAAFFDYDKDGDLDCYILNNSFRAVGSFDLRQNLRFTRDSLGGHKLYRNDNGQFKDVSVEAGILGSVIAFGLGVTVGDVDLDGWQDIYVSNDFFEKDYLYHNRGDGTFEEVLEKQMRHISSASMGADMADLNNDAYPEIFVTDMLPEPDARIKTTTTFESADRFEFVRSNGYYNQFTRNALHLNNADGTFSEIACLAGVEATDWSWGALLCDLDNDGWRDIYVANGIAQDLTNQDYLNFVSDPVVQSEIITGGNVDFKRLIDSIPSQPVPNYAFKNNGNLRFENVAASWGLAQPGFSNGSAYGDLDNDGDLDLLVNNVNSEAFVYRNEADNQLKDNHFLKVQLQGEAPNTGAFGARVFLRAQGKTIYQEVLPMRGFQSSMDVRPNFGLGNVAQIDTLLVEWLDGKTTLLTNVAANQILTLKHSEANHPPVEKPWLKPSIAPVFQKITAAAGPDWQHRESNFRDWDRDRLLYFSHSTDGPRMAVGDVDGDSRDDYYIGGAAGQAGALFVQQSNGKFRQSPQPAFAADAACEDTDAVLFDADADGDLDLYVTSGSNEAASMSPELTDRLYLNDGKGRFSRAKDQIPGDKPFASGCVRAADADGDQDLFVGMRLLPEKVGVPVGGFLLLNDGKGRFAPSIQEVFKNMGLITDAAWADVDGDGDSDIVAVGEWMSIRVILNNGKAGFYNDNSDNGLRRLNGLWKRIQPADFNGDGQVDFIVGNMGLNSRLEAATDQPLTMFFSDFDKNGVTEQILCRYNGGVLLPYVLRGDLVGNMPALKKKYLRFGNYAGQTMTDIFKPEQMREALELKVEELRSGVLINEGNGKFSFIPLPVEAQFAPLFGLCTGDFDGDGKTDVLCGGNFLGCKPEFGYMDADYGLFLKGDGQGGFKAIRARESGFRLDGQVRDIRPARVAGKPAWLVARNNAAVEIFSLGKVK